MPQNPSRLIAAAALLSLVYLGVALPQLDRYGTTWDFGKVFYGERYLSVYLDRDLRHLDFHRATIAWPPGHPDLDTMVTEGPDTCWPLGATAAAFTHRLLGKTLGLLPPLASYYAAPALFAALLAFLMTWYVGRAFGLAAGIATGLLLLAHPIFFGHTLVNFQDVPATATFALAVIAGERFLTRRTLASALVGGLAFGLALAAKTNAVFALPVLALYAPFVPGKSGGAAAFLRFAGKALLGYAVVAPLVLLALWPWLWQDTFAHLALHLERLLQDSHAQEAGGKGFVTAVLCTPPVVTLAALAGLLGPIVLREERRRTAILLALWCLVPLARASLPDIKNYDGLRRYLEFVPALAALAAIGCWMVGGTLARPGFARAVLSLVVVASSLLSLAFSLPWSLAYQNRIASALGVSAPGANDFWATSYRAGLAWIASRESGPADVFAGKGAHVARQDLALFGPDRLHVFGPRVGRDFLPPHGFYVMYVTRPEFQSPLLELLEKREAPVHVIALGSRPLLRIYRVDDGTPLQTEIVALAAREDAALAARLAAFEQAVRSNPESLEALKGYATCLALSVSSEEALARLRPLRDGIKRVQDRWSFDALLAQFEDPKVFMGKDRGEPARAGAQTPR